MTTATQFRIEHLPKCQMVVLHFGDHMPESFESWDWHGMRRCVRRRIGDQEDRHCALIELARLERDMQTWQMRQWVQQDRRYAPQWLVGGFVLTWCVAGLLAAVAAFMWVCGWLR